ncbi:hypothetical protein ACIBJF_50035 [Streptomyces sp. NPDC050743]|uniref:hypothetical protein n=1 Tax=Streptomyces sp. NPDC050743 TaxID=3365634 RepID=UPI003792A86A
MTWRHDPARRHALSLSAFRLEDARGRPTGVAALYIDSTEGLHARRHLDLARKVAEQVGGSLDVVRTAQDLADVLVPGLGDLAAVDLAHSVFETYSQQHSAPDRRTHQVVEEAHSACDPRKVDHG